MKFPVSAALVAVSVRANDPDAALQLLQTRAKEGIVANQLRDEQAEGAKGDAVANQLPYYNKFHENPMGIDGTNRKCQYDGVTWTEGGERLFRVRDNESGVDGVADPAACAALCRDYTYGGDDPKYQGKKCRFFSFRPAKTGFKSRCIGCYDIQEVKNPNPDSVKSTTMKGSTLYALGQNVAIGQTPVVSSSCYEDGDKLPKYLTDGVTTHTVAGKYWHSCALNSPCQASDTQCIDTMPTVTIPLKTVVEVGDVTVHNRCNCCPERLQGFEVYAGDMRCGTFPAGTEKCKPYTVNCGGKLATEVSVKKANGNANFVELQVWGVPVAEVERCWVKMNDVCTPDPGAGSGGKGILDEIGAWTTASGEVHSGTQWFVDRKKGGQPQSTSAQACYDRQAAYDNYCKVPSGTATFRWQSEKPEATCWVKLCDSCNPVAGAGSGGQGILDEIFAWTDDEGTEHNGTMWFEDRKLNQGPQSTSEEACFQAQARYDAYCRVSAGTTKLRWQSNKPTVDGCSVLVAGLPGTQNVPKYTLNTMNFKCQMQMIADGGERIWRKDGLADISECAVWCKNTKDCNFFTFGLHKGIDTTWCMACTDIQNKDSNAKGWGVYEMQATRKKAKEHCESAGKALCNKAQVMVGDSNGCTVAWMADSKGYWRTSGDVGCGTTGNRLTLVDYGEAGQAGYVYCCNADGACSSPGATGISLTSFIVPSR